MKQSLLSSGLFIPCFQFPLLENQFVSSIHKQFTKNFSARCALYSCLRISDFASASNCSLVLPQMILIWQSSNSWLDLRFLWHPVTGFPVHAQKWLCTLKQAFPLWVINLQQARTCFSLMKVQWWSQRIPGVHVVNLSIWVLRVVVAKVADCLDIRALEEWSCCVKVFSQFSSWKFLDLLHLTFLQFFHVSYIPNTSFKKSPILFWHFFLK